MKVQNFTEVFYLKVFQISVLFYNEGEFQAKYPCYWPQIKRI